jgi:tetratricopeptide (TPR) repeat protein
MAFFTKKSFFYVFASSSIIGICAIFFWHDTIGVWFWQRFHTERIALLLHRDDPDMLFEMGNSHFGGSGSYDIALAQRYYTETLRLRYTFPEAHYQLGRTYFINGKFSSALFEIRETLRYNPEFKKAYYMYGLISGYANDLDGALWGFSEFIKRDDFNWAGYNDLAWVYFKKGDYQKVKEVSEQGLSKAPNNPWLNNIYGTALLNLGNHEDALIAFRLALEQSEQLTALDWGRSYPGNDPRIYASGIEEMRNTIRNNIQLAEKTLSQ